MGNETMKKVAWFITKKKLIKFQDSDETYDVVDNVMEKSDFAKFPIKKNNAVNVTIEDGKVVFLQKVKSDAKTEAPKEEKKAEKKAEEKVSDKKSEETPAEEPKASGDGETLTVLAVAKNKKVLKFNEKEGWIKVSTELQEKDYAEIGLSARSTVKVVFKDDEIVSCVKVGDAPAKTEGKKTSSSSKTSYSNNDTDRQKSIEAQSCMNSACAIVAQLVGADVSKASASTINAMKKAIAIHSFELLQELKSK